MKFAYRQELVLQLPASSITDYDALVELEDRIIAGLGNLGEIAQCLPSSRGRNGTGDLVSANRDNETA
jgi:hypothetical protein